MIFAKRLLALVLTLVLLLGVSACDDKATESSDTSSKESIAEISSETSHESTESSDESSLEESSEPPPPPEPTAAEVFAEAASFWAETDNYHHEIEITSERYVGSIGYTEEWEREADYLGIGTDSFCALIDNEQILMDSVIRSEEYYADGKAYLIYNSTENKYVSDMTSESYLERVLPAVILDPALYETVEFANEDKTEIRFEGASDAESWLASYSLWINEANGTAYLDKDGAIERMEYTVSYNRGPVMATDIYTVELSESKRNAEDIPAFSEEFAPVETIDLPKILDYASYMLLSLPGGTGSNNIEIGSQLAGIYLLEHFSFSSIVCEDGNMLMELDDEYLLQTADEGYSQTWNALYKDGEVTYTQDGKENPRAVDFDWMQSVLYAAFTSVTIPEPSFMESIRFEDIGDFWIVEYDIDPAHAKDVEQYALSLVLQDPTVVDQYSSEFRVTTFTGKLSIDKDTGFLTASSCTLEAEHIVNGDPYVFLFSRDMTMSFGDISAYENITGEPYPDTEPPEEEKATPVFYEVTDDSGGKLYLLGTIHIGDDRTAFLPDEIYAALEEADALAVEMNTHTMEDRLLADAALYHAYMDANFYTDDGTLKEHIPETLYQQVADRMYALGYAQLTDQMRPSAIITDYMAALTDSCNYLFSLKGVDERLLTLAENADKKIYEIEDIKEHLLTMSKLSPETQQALLEECVQYKRADALASNLYSFDLWCNGDPQAWEEYLDSEYEGEMTEELRKAYEEYDRVLEGDRNGVMFEKIKDYLASDETVFAAVGMAHILGDGGLADQLTDAGYTVKLVEYQ